MVLHICNSLACLQKAEHALFNTDAHLCVNLESIIDYIHNHITNLDLHLYHILVTTALEHVLTLSTIHTMTVRALTLFPTLVTPYYNDTHSSLIRATQEAAKHCAAARQEC